MANERLYQFPSKPTPVPADIIYLGDSANGFNECNSTIAQIISAYPNLSGIAGLTLGANTYPYSNNSAVLTAGSITTLGVSLLADSTIAAMQGTLGFTPIPAASIFAGWDANKNLSANNFISAYTTTATAGATTTLVVGSTFQQYFTGSTTQTVLLPVTSTLVLGQSFYIVNNSSGVVTVESSGGNTVQAMAASTILLATCILTSGTTAASWNIYYIDNASGSYANSGANNNITSMTGLTGYIAAPLGFKDSLGNIGFQMTYAASAVNYLEFVNNATGLPPNIIAQGSDASVAIQLQTKNGDLWLGDNTGTIAPAFRWYNAAQTYYVGFRAPTLSANQIWKLPTADGSAGQFIKTDASGNLAFSSTLPASAVLQTPASGNLSNCTNYPMSALTGLGTGVATALANNVGSAGAPVTYGGAGGIPSSITLTNATGLPATTGISGLPSFAAYDTTGTTLGATAFTKITFNTKNFDIGTLYSTVNARWTPGVAGIYFINASLYIPSAVSNKEYVISIYVSGSAVLNSVTQFTATITDLPLTVSGTVQLGATDYVEIFVYNGNSSTIVTQSGQPNNMFSGFWVGGLS